MSACLLYHLGVVCLSRGLKFTGTRSLDWTGQGRILQRTEDAPYGVVTLFRVVPAEYTAWAPSFDWAPVAVSRFQLHHLVQTSLCLVERCVN